MMTTEMFEGPDGLLYANPAECADAWAHEATSLRAALAEAERDAERYRWMRNHWYHDERFHGEVFDKEIDAAMAREEE